jgi:hypothetical protein
LTPFVQQSLFPGRATLPFVVKSVRNLDEFGKPYSLNTACCKVEAGPEGISQYALDFSLLGLSVTLLLARLQPGEHWGASIESD